MKQHSDAVARAAQTLRADGASYSEIAKILGLRNAKSSVQQLLKRDLGPPEPLPFIRPTALPIINRGCQWIDGDVQGEWSWCGAQVEPGEPWCANHRQRVYVSAARSGRMLREPNE